MTCIEELLPRFLNIPNRPYYPITLSGLGGYLSPANGSDLYFCLYPGDNICSHDYCSNAKYYFEERTEYYGHKGHGMVICWLDWDAGDTCWYLTFYHVYEGTSYYSGAVTLTFSGPSDPDNPSGTYTLVDCEGYEPDCAASTNAAATVGTVFPTQHEVQYPVGSNCISVFLSEAYDTYEAMAQTDFYCGPEIARPSGPTCIQDILDDLETARQNLWDYMEYDYSSAFQVCFGLPNSVKATLSGFPDPPFSGVDGVYTLTEDGTNRYYYSDSDLEIILKMGAGGYDWRGWACSVSYLGGTYGVFLKSAAAESYYPWNPYHSYNIISAYPSPGNVDWSPSILIESL